MSEKDTAHKDSKNVFAACQDNVDTLLNGIRQSVPHYHQSITNVQQEYLQTYENILDLSITLQEEYVKKAGIGANLPESTLKIIRDATEVFVKTAAIQNKIVLSTIDVTQQNIKTFNDNVTSFSNLSKNILQSRISVFTAKSNQ